MRWYRMRVSLYFASGETVRNRVVVSKTESTKFLVDGSWSVDDGVGSVTEGSVRTRKSAGVGVRRAVPNTVLKPV